MSKRKQKRIRRAYMKPYSAEVINAGQGIDKRYIERFKDNGRSFGRVISGPIIGFQENGLPLLPRLVHPDAMPVSRSHIDENGKYHPSVSQEKRENEKKIRQHVLVEKINYNWDGGERIQKIETLTRILVIPGKVKRVWLYYGMNNFIFVEETAWQLRASIRYTSRDRAYRALGVNGEGIAWVEIQVRKQEP